MNTHRKVAKDAKKGKTQVLEFFARCRVFAMKIRNPQSEIRNRKG